MFIKMNEIFQNHSVVKFPLVLIMLATIFFKESIFALDLINENKSFIQSCLIPQLKSHALQRKDLPSIEELSHYSSSPDFINPQKNYFKTPISAAVDLLTTVELLGITGQIWSGIYFKESNDCLHDHFTSLAKKYKLDLDNLFLNTMNFTSPTIRIETHKLTQSKMNFFILFYTPRHSNFVGFSWSHFLWNNSANNSFKS